MKFGTDGVRGIANIELTTEFAFRLGRAAARVLTPADGAVTTAQREVVIGGDTRESTPTLSAALAEGFAAEGVDVVDLGTATTPLVAFEAHRRGSAGAVVSASHNPWTDNGIKLFGVGGRKLADDVEARIEAELAALDAPVDRDESAHAAAGEITTSSDTGPYRDHVQSALVGGDLAGMRIVLDAANGAGFDVAPAVLRAAGADVVVIADEPSGRNINDGCGAMHPELVGAAVVQHGADLGVALDGDADRLIAVDSTGAVVDGDHIIAICATDLHGRGKLAHDTVVVTVMTNLGFRLAMDEAGIDVVETAVGDRYILEALASGGYSLGGEQSGHVIFADHGTTGDGLFTALSLIDIVKRSGRPLSELAAATMTSLPQVLVNVRVSHRVTDVAGQMAAEIADVESDLAGSGRVLVRASGTEPLVRVMIEAPTAQQAQAAADRLADAARARFVDADSAERLS